jgi:hypothetical protein
MLTVEQFIALAEQKIALCLSDPRGVEPRVESICGPGVDLTFDQLISALGHIARQKPKPLIDTLMLWRKGKSEAANAARIELNLVCSCHTHIQAMLTSFRPRASTPQSAYLAPLQLTLL